MIEINDDETASRILTEAKQTTGDEREQMADALIAYGEKKAAEEYNAADEHFSKLFTDEAYFEQEKQANAAVQESPDPDQAAKRTLVGAWLEHRMGRPIDTMSYQAERDAYAMANYGKKNLDDAQFFDFVRGEYEWQKKKTEAINDLQMQAVAKAINDSQLGQNRPFVDGMTEVFNEWQSKYPELVDGQNDAAFLSQGYKLYNDTIRDLDTVRPQASKALSTLTAFTQGSATDEELQSLANDFVGAPPEDRQKIYKYVTLAAQAGQIDRAGLEQFAINMGQAFTRGFDFIPQGSLQIQESGVNEVLQAVQKGQQVWVPQNGDLTKATVAEKTPKAQVLGQAPTTGMFATPQDGYREATPEEAVQFATYAKNAMESFKVVRELRNVAKTGIDPIRPVLEENSFWGTAERGAYGLAGSIPLMGATAVNPYLGVLAYQATEYDRIMLENPDIDPQFAQGLALVEGAANAAIDRVQLKSLSGKLPMFGRYLDRIKSDGIRRTIKIGANVVEQNLQEGAQDLIAPVLETAVAALREDMPDKDFSSLMDEWAGQRAETFFATLPLALIGGGIATYQDIKNPSAELNATKLRQVGFDKEQVTFIQRAENPEEYTARIQMEWGKRTPENIQAGRQEVIAEMQKAATPGENDARISESIAEDGTRRWVVTAPDGRELLQTQDQQAALEAVRQHSEAQMINERNTVADMVDYFRAQDPTNTATIEAPRTVQQELDRLTEAGDAKGIANLNERIRFAGIPEGADLTAYNILGEANVETTAEGVFRGVIKLRENSRPEDAFEEINHVFVRKAIAEGRVTLDALRGWVTQTAEATGETYASETETDIIENIAKIGMDYAAGRIEETSLPASFVDYIKRMLQVFKEAMARALKLKDAFATGKIDANFESFLAESVGLNQQTLVDTTRDRVSNEVLTDTNFSIGSKPYPMEDKGKWYSNEDFEQRGGRIVTMSPDQFLSQVRPLEVDDASRDNIDDLKNMMQSGRKLDPLTIYADGKEDGRHRAIAAKELGITSVPVIDFRQPVSAYTNNSGIGENTPDWHSSADDFQKHWTDRGVVNSTQIYGGGKYIKPGKIIVVEGSRNSGLGTEFMRDLTAFADSKAMQIRVTPSKDFGATSVDRLKKFYKRFGFVENSGRNKDYEISDTMYRNPSPAATNYSIGFAPNGKPSNLKPEEQATAKTPEFKQWGGNWEFLSHKQFLNGSPVSILAGGEFKKIDGQSLIDRVASWFASKHQNKAFNSIVGEVALTKNGVSDSLAHGIGRDKADAFAAVPEVISKGRVVDYQKNWKGRGYDSVTLAAPIQIAGKDFIALAIVIREQNKQRFYLHEVGLRERLQQSDAFKSGASAEEQASVEPSGARSEGAIKKLLRGIFAVNPESITVKTDENGEPLASEIARFRQETGTSNYSIASKSEIDRVNRALGGMNRGPDERLKVYERAKAKFSTLLQNNQQALDNLRAGTVSFRRTQLLQALGELDAILSIFPPDIRGRVGGYTRLASIAPHDVFKDGEKVSEVSGMNGAIISAWMREGLSIGPAGQQTELPPGYTAKENLGTARADRAIADFFKKRIEMIDRELEKTLRREYDEAFRKLLDRTKPKKAKPGEKPKGIGGDIQDLFAVVRDSVDMNATQVAAHIAGLDSMIASGDLTAEQEARAMVEAALVALTGDWKNADADRRRTAFMEASRIWNGAYATHAQKIIRQREEREIARAEAVIATGKAGELAGRKSKAIADSGLKGSWKDYILNLLNFDQVVGVLFGENTEVANTIIDKQRRAENAKEDGSQAKMQELEDFFTGLAGGNVLDGERLRYRLTQPSMTVKGIEMSELEALSAVMMWVQEDGRRHMEGEMDEAGRPVGKWHYNQDFVDEILANLSEEALALRSWLTRNYANEYAKINEVYSELNGVNLPQIQLYSPVTVQPVNAPTGQVLDPVSGSAMSGASTSPGALRTRGTAIAEPRFQDVLQTYISHTLQMEHWKAFAPMIAEANGILRNRDVQNSVEEKGGVEARKMLNAWLDYFAQGGTRDAGAHLALNQGLNNVLGRASQVALVGRASTLLIQSTQLGAALAEMPVKAYLKRMGKLLTGQLGWDSALNSDYIQRRVKQMPPVVQLAMQGLKGARPTAIQQAGKRLGMLLSGADGLFTAGTYAITYDYHLTKAKELGLAGQEAEDYARNTAERVTDRIAQPTRAGARSLYENTSTNPLARAGWAFASEARKNLALVAYSFAERDTATKMRTLAYVVALNAIGSAILRSIWRDILDDEDDELFDDKYWSPKRIATAIATEPLYGFPVLGSVVQEAVYKSFGEYKPSESLFSVQNAIGPIKRLPDHLSGDTDLREVMRDIDMVVSALGIMHPNIAATASITHLAKDLFNLTDSTVDAVTEN